MMLLFLPVWLKNEICAEKHLIESATYGMYGVSGWMQVTSIYECDKKQIWIE